MKIIFTIREDILDLIGYFCTVYSIALNTSLRCLRKWSIGKHVRKRIKIWYENFHFCCWMAEIYECPIKKTNCYCVKINQSPRLLYFSIPIKRCNEQETYQNVFGSTSLALNLRGWLIHRHHCLWIVDYTFTHTSHMYTCYIKSACNRKYTNSESELSFYYLYEVIFWRIFFFSNTFLAYMNIINWSDHIIYFASDSVVYNSIMSDQLNI